MCFQAAFADTGSQNSKFTEMQSDDFTAPIYEALYKSFYCKHNY